MFARSRLSCLSLEDRANPSGPELIDPYTGLVLAAPQDPTDPALTTTTGGTADATQIAIDTALAGATASTTDVVPNTSDTYNSIYKADTLDLIYVGTP